MWAKQLKKKHPPVITIFVGGMSTIPKWVVYGIVLSFNHIMGIPKSGQPLHHFLQGASPTCSAARAASLMRGSICSCTGAAKSAVGAWVSFEDRLGIHSKHQGTKTNLANITIKIGEHGWYSAKNHNENNQSNNMACAQICNGFRVSMQHHHFCQLYNTQGISLYSH